MDAKLKTLKVPELKAVLAAAGVPLPSKANKADIIAAILASQPALDAYYALHEPEHAAVTTAKEPDPVAEEPVSPPKTAEVIEPAVPAPAEDAAPAAVDVEAEKRKQRAARFGIPIVEPKVPKQKQPAPAQPAQDTEKLKSRAARFGITPAPQPPSKRKQAPEPEVDEEELARRKKRAERFGTAPKS